MMPREAARKLLRSAAGAFLTGTLAISLVGGPYVLRLSSAEDKIAKKVDDNVRLGADKHPLGPALQMARSSQETLAKVKDYSTVFIKKERIKGKLLQQSMLMKVRQDPFAVYIKYQDPHAGREVIYVDGKNKGKLLVHEEGIVGLVGTLSFAPTSPEAMEENRHPVSKAGMKTMLDLLVAQWESELKYGETDVKFYPNAKVGSVDCKLIESSHPEKRPHFNFQKSCLYVDKQTNLPIRLEQYGFPAKAGEASPVEEEYSYTNIRLNIGLTETDFDTKNKNYNF